MDYSKEFKRVRKQMNWSKSQLAGLLDIQSIEEITNIEKSNKIISEKHKKSFDYILKLIEQGCEFKLRINKNE